MAGGSGLNCCCDERCIDTLNHYIRKLIKVCSKNCMVRSLPTDGVQKLQSDSRQEQGTHACRRHVLVSGGACRSGHPSSTCNRLLPSAGYRCIQPCNISWVAEQMWQAGYQPAMQRLRAPGAPTVASSQRRHRGCRGRRQSAAPRQRWMRGSDRGCSTSRGGWLPGPSATATCCQAPSSALFTTLSWAQLSSTSIMMMKQGCCEVGPQAPCSAALPWCTWQGRWEA